MERSIATVRTADGAELHVESIGSPDDPALLLSGGSAWSKDWWDDAFCERLVAGGRRVIRYDNRDTGESTSYPPGAPGYDGNDLVEDAIAILDALDVERAHLVGLSMGGGIAQEVALRHRERVASIALLATSPAAEHDQGDLPGPTAAAAAVFAGETPEPDWDDRAAVVTYVVEAERPFAGSYGFDEPRTRAIAERVVDRTRDMAASMANHFAMDQGESDDRRLGELAGLPTLVIHGTDDPLFPVEHGRALAAEIPGARLIELEGMGHELPPPATWDLVVAELVEHTRAA